MTRAPADVLVIGAGVSGLTTAVCLGEAGMSVHVYTSDPPQCTTSYAAGAIWGQYLAAHGEAERWSRETLTTFEKLAAQGDCGVRIVAGVEAARVQVDPPIWATEIPDFCRCTVAELPAGFVSGWRYAVPIVDMPVYLGYLSDRLTAAKGTIRFAPVESLEKAAEVAPIVVNCAGFGARSLVPDEELIPIRGELVVVDNPGIDWFFAEHTEDVAELTYFLPHGEYVVLGGTAEPGRLDLDLDPASATAIIDRCGRIEPSLAGATVREHRVGLRPTRPRVRLEHVRSGPADVFHNYGHGGAGVSLSWGCAREISRLVESLSSAEENG
jgi:D-amino-acid oxidase